MNRKPLVILGSARKESNTRKLINLIFSEIDIELIDLLDYYLQPYNYEGNYSKDDRFVEICNAILNHNKIVFATPVYWYSMSGIMKVFFDRLTDIITIHKDIRLEMKGKNVFLISTGSEDSLPSGFENPFRLTSKYLNMNFIYTYYCKANNLENTQTNWIETYREAFI